MVRASRTVRITVVAAAALTAMAFGAPSASANAEDQDGPVTITVTGESTTVYKTMTTLAVDNGYSGNLQAYYLIVPPGEDGPRRAEKQYSEHILQGPFRPGVARDSYGPTGGFLHGTRLCAAWWDPTGKTTIPGIACVTIKQ